MPEGIHTTCPPAFTLAAIGAFAAMVCSSAGAASPGARHSAARARATAVALGGFHTCALTRAGGVKCWGDNVIGELGDGTSKHQRLTPVDVSGLTRGVAAITASCALTSAGAVKCWGRIGGGKRGDPLMRVYRKPVVIAGLGSGVAAISAGGGHRCVLTDEGGVKCWGSNSRGQLGDRTSHPHSRPVDVYGLRHGVAAIAAGSEHTCALTRAGGVKCWGYNLNGQLGDGTRHTHYRPVAVSGLARGVAAIAAGGRHTCALTRVGGVKCWGYNYDGELGDGTSTGRHTPVAVSGLARGVAAISAGDGHSCAVTNGGGVKCWGNNNSGQLGDGTTTNRLRPVVVSGLASRGAAVAAGMESTCAVSTAGRVKCWGYNEYGQLGDGTQGDRHKPVAVVGFGGTLTCVVPNVLGWRLGKAKPWIRRNHCRVGTVTRVASTKRKDTIVGQSPRPWKRLKKGARVNLKISRGR